MNQYVKIAVLENEVEAQLLKAMLEERNIPHVMRSYHDPAYDGIFQITKGWGRIEAEEKDREEIEQLLQDLRSSDSESN